jgi:hypothetical protein
MVWETFRKGTTATSTSEFQCKTIPPKGWGYGPVVQRRIGSSPYQESSPPSFSHSCQILQKNLTSSKTKK